MASTIRQINMLKISLSKRLATSGGAVETLSDEDVESLKDMLQQLESLEVNLEVLTKTLIGTIVSKFKKHEVIGPTAKALVKKWKAIAKGEVSNKKPPPPAAAEAAAAAVTKPPAAAAATGKETPAESTTVTATATVSATAKPERRTSTNAATAEMREQWFSLQPYRQTTCQKLYEILGKLKSKLLQQGINADAIDHLVVERATDVEQAIQAKFGYQQRSEYLGKARSLCFNIKKNDALACQIILGKVLSQELVELSSEQLVSEKKRQEIEARKKNHMDSNLLDWDTQNEDKINEMCGITGDLLNASLFTCGRCKSPKTTSTQKQTRSADEPMTVFVLCLNCNNRWKFS
mmetsp:Transcript_59430/g.66513  ORF Transcript_59430/g.66513 Transcript_59430/m.66513 type:complete len:349 (+) Transcript_59430:220-1266(+)